ASNDFNQLFTALERARRDGLFGVNVYPSVIGGSFYGPLRPPGTVHFATCFNAVHWLDRVPTIAFDDFVSYRPPLPGRPGLASAPAITAAFRRQAERDLIRFLECRARELAAGGRLVIAAPGDSDEVRISDGLWDAFNDACLDLVAAGELPRDMYE